jgi:hypothetical protein
MLKSYENFAKRLLTGLSHGEDFPCEERAIALPCTSVGLSAANRHRMSSCPGGKDIIYHGNSVRIKRKE